MPRQRNVIKYGSASLFLTDSPAKDPNTRNVYFLNRVQSISLSMSINRQDIMQMGSDDFVARKIIGEPEVTLSFDYLLTDGYEDHILGLNVFPNPLEYTDYYGVRNVTEDFKKRGTIYNNLREDKSIFLMVGPEDGDVIGRNAIKNNWLDYDAIGIGNCFITNYSISASVGGFATASVEMRCSNITYTCFKQNPGEGFEWFEDVLEIFSLLSQEDLDETDFIRQQNSGRIDLQGSGEIVSKKYFGLQSPSLDLIEKGKAIEDKGVVFEPLMYNSVMSAASQGSINLSIRNPDHGGPIFDSYSKVKHRQGHEFNRLQSSGCFHAVANAQSINVSVPFAREDLLGFESMHVYGRKLKKPQVGNIQISLSANAFESGRLEELLCDDNTYDLEIDIVNKCSFSCVRAEERDKHMSFMIENAKLDGYQFNANIGSNADVTCNFSFGMSPKNGLMISGTYMNAASSPCSISDLMSPRNLHIDDVTDYGESNIPSSPLNPGAEQTF